MRDVIYRDDAIRIASGYCHPANVVKELKKLPSAEPECKTGRWIEEVNRWLDPDIDNELALEKIRAIVYGAKMDETQKNPCDDCQEFDCYGCEYAERKEE